MTAAGLTTLHLVSWLGALLASHPQAQAQLRSEILTLGAQDSSRLEKLEQLPYLTSVIQEGLRLYPPAPFLLRRHPEHGLTFISVWAMHRHPAFWENPDEFQPERWLSKEQRPAFIPFGLGPRTCVGKRFAMTEARVMLAELLRSFELLPCSKLPSPLLTVLTRPTRAIHLGIRPLSQPMETRAKIA